MKYADTILVASAAPCRDCGDIFTMDENDINWYETRGLYQPEHCPECRKKRKKARELCLAAQ